MGSTSTSLQQQPPERRLPLRLISLAGWGLFVVWAVILVTWAVIEPEPYRQGWRLVLELAFVGRLVSVADGIANDFSRSYLLIQNGLQDIILLLVVYPMVVAAHEGASKRGLLAGAVDRVRGAAERNRRMVEPLGVIGLWVFVFFPFWSTGALVGGAVGYLLGMRTTTIFLSVFSGHLISVVSIIWFFESMRGVMETFSEGAIRFLPWYALGLLLLWALAARAFGWLRRR